MKTIPLYTLDYNLPPADRWAALPQYLIESGRVLARRALQEYHESAMLEPVAVFLRLASKWRNPYRAEIKSLAQVLEISRRDAFLTNFVYEINQLGHYASDHWAEDWESVYRHTQDLAGKIKAHLQRIRDTAIACTAGAGPLPDYGMVHVRSLDWPLEGLGRHSLIVHHQNNPAGDFYSVGWPGYCGVLSGFKPGCFSASLNMAFIVQRPGLSWPPSHLLRWVFENCCTYAEALEVLRNTPVCVPAFILLSSASGTAVVELAPEGNRVHRGAAGKPLVVANSYFDTDKRSAVDELGYETDSDQRANTLKCRMQKARRGGIVAAHRLLTAWPVQHSMAMQQMVFSHATGEMLVVGREADEAVRRRLIQCGSGMSGYG
jgi:hypothetical protein